MNAHEWAWRIIALVSLGASISAIAMSAVALNIVNR